jgi:hypothetical protein
MCVSEGQAPQLSLRVHPNSSSEGAETQNDVLTIPMNAPSV